MQTSQNYRVAVNCYAFDRFTLRRTFKVSVTSFHPMLWFRRCYRLLVAQPTMTDSATLYMIGIGLIAFLRDDRVLADGLRAHRHHCRGCNNNVTTENAHRAAGCEVDSIASSHLK
jgi:hypothetical protein